MNEELFFQKIAEALDSNTGLSRGQPLGSLAEWDSLGILSILDFFEGEGVDVDLNDLREAQTTDDLLNLARPIVGGV